MLSADARLHTDVGHFLDQDVVHLKNGDFIRGWVIEEGSQDILIDTEKGSFTLPRSSCKSIDKNFLARYIRRVM